MSDIARLAGVSSSTVSRALAGSPLVRAHKREEIHRLARERGYVVNSTARNLRLQRTQTLGVVIPLPHATSLPLSDPFLMEMLGHLVDAITERGYGMFLQKIAPPMDDWFANLIGSQRVDGLIVIGQSSEHAVLETAAPIYKPLVVWGGQLVAQSYCTVGTDNIGGARAVVEHLLGLGRQRILFVGDPAMPEIGLRYAGYCLAHERAPRLRPLPPLVPAQLTAESAYQAIRAFIGSGAAFDAVFGATDVIAMSALRALGASGLAVPRDVAVVGFDDIALAAHANPPLTTVRQDLQRGARTLVDLLFRRMAGEDTPSAIMPGELVVRESSGRAAG